MQVIKLCYDERSILYIYVMSYYKREILYGKGQLNFSDLKVKIVLTDQWSRTFMKYSKLYINLWVTFLSKNFSLPLFYGKMETDRLVIDQWYYI